MKEHTLFLPYGAFLTHVFRKFKLDLASKISVVKVFDDRSVLHRMKLLDIPPPQHTPPPPPQSSTQPPSSSSQPPPTQPTPPYFSDAHIIIPSLLRSWKFKINKPP